MEVGSGEKQNQSLWQLLTVLDAGRKVLGWGALVQRGQDRGPHLYTVVDGELRDGRGSSRGGRNQRRPSPPETACSGEIPASCCSPCSS